MSTPAGQAAAASITEHLVAALSATWRAIQVRRPDVPDIVLSLGSGTVGARRGVVTLATSRHRVGTPPTRAMPAPAGRAGDGGVVRW